MFLRSISFLLLASTVHSLFPGRLPDEGDVRHMYPITQIVIGLTDHAHVLPYMLGWLENLDYPKHRILLEIYLNGKEDPTSDQILWWKETVPHLFHSVKILTDKEEWMEAGLRSARIRKTSNILMLSGDTLVYDVNILKKLSLNSNHYIVSALLNPISEGLPWNVEDLPDVTDNGKLEHRVKQDMVALPMLIRLDVMDASYLTFSPDNLHNYVGSNDPLEVFSQSAARMNVDIWLDSLDNYGVYIDPDLEIEKKRSAMRYHLCDLVADGFPLPVYSRTIRPWRPEPELMGMDRIFLINLLRRPDRLRKMSKIFEIQGISFTPLDAVDGFKLSENKLSYQILPGYLDPFHKRPIKAGEIGCFLSHYRVWQEVVDKKLSRVIVFEDDLRVSFGGFERIREVLEDLDASNLKWDLIYLGRKKLADQEELWVPKHRHLSTVGYSYWTLGYMLSLSGAQKLLDARPLQNVLPVDEYIPIMFDRHPNQNWTSYFPVRNLHAFTMYPLVVTPQKYTFEPGYVSDTEDSSIFSPQTEFLADQSEKDEL